MLKNLKMALFEEYERNKLSNGAIALKCGLKESELSRIIFEKIKPKDHQKKALSEFLGKSEKYLFGEN